MDVSQSYYRHGPSLRTARHRKASSRWGELDSLTFKERVWRDEEILPGLSDSSSQRHQLCCLSLATLARLKPTGPDGTLPEQNPSDHHRPAQNNFTTGVLAQVQQQVTVANEKTHRPPTNHTRRALLEEPCLHRLK